MDRWVAKKNELQTKVACEKVRALKTVTKEQVLRHLQTALKRTPKQLITYFIEKIILFNDHIDIYCKSIKTDDPDSEESRREFSFYEVKMTVEVDRHTFGGEKEKQTYAIVLWI